MKFRIKSSYNLDLLNFLNILTGDKLYVNYHEEEYEKFKDKISMKSQINLRKIVEINENTMIGPMLALVLSSVPNFECMDLYEILKRPNLIYKSFFRYNDYFSEFDWNRKKEIFELLLPIIKDIETLGFWRYWSYEKLPQIKEKRKDMVRYCFSSDLQNEMELMFGNSSRIDEITVYLGVFSPPHGVKLCGNRYAADISWDESIILSTAVHEMFHPPYNRNEFYKDICQLKQDKLVIKAFNAQNPKFAYKSLQGFIEENIVEAMAIKVCNRIGLEDDPYEYFKQHDEGSHKLSVVLLEYFEKYPKTGNESFKRYFKRLIKYMPIGNLDREYERIVGE